MVTKFGGFAPNDVFNTIQFGGFKINLAAEKKSGGLKAYHQTTKFSSPPNFPAIILWYLQSASQ